MKKKEFRSSGVQNDSNAVTLATSLTPDSAAWHKPYSCNSCNSCNSCILPSYLSRCHERLVEAMADKPGRLVAVLAPWDFGYDVGAGTDIHDPGDY